MNPFIKKILIGVLGLLSPITCVCTINFTDAGGNIAIDTTNSALSISNPAKVVGWGQRSVVKAFGDNASTAWPETYTNNAVIAQTGGTIPARTYLVDANSNAINPTGSLLRATSNLLLYTARTYSSSIIVLRQRSDSTNVSIRTTSNAVNLFSRNLAVPVADGVDGTQYVKYCANHHVFHNSSYNVRGWVRFNNGFTIMPQGTVLMDTLTTVSGPIDLRDTGYLALNNDLYLAHNVTLTTGGYIEGQAGMGGVANTIFMGGDLTLASDSYGKVLHITGNWNSSNHSGDTIIDGCGHTLTIGDWGQIFVDQNVTLTLRNMTIRTSANSANKPAILLAAHTSKLALDNVVFDLGADFQFKQGQLFIHDEVAVTGTSAFIYTSPKPSYITSGATWSFETGTTFSIAPSTYTDQPFTAGTNTSNNFIVLADQTAALSLSNCSLKTTYTGARLSKGMILFDNKVAIDTQAGVDSTMSATGVAVYSAGVTCTSMSISPDGRYIAVGALDSGPLVRVGRFTGTSFPQSYFVHPLASAMVPAVAWSPDGRFLAVGSDSSGQQLQIWRFIEGIPLTQIATKTFGLFVNTVAWSPDGRYLAAGGNNGTTPLIIYRFNGTSLTQVTTANPDSTTIQVNGIAWSPDGKYLAVAHRKNDAYPGARSIYSFNGSSLTQIVNGSNLGNSTTIAWSPDGRMLAWGGYNYLGYQTAIYTFNGTTITGVIAQLSLGTQVNAVSWSPDGRYLLACGSNGGSGRFQLYNINTSGATALLTQDQPFGTIATAVTWGPDSRYALVIGNNKSSGKADLMSYPIKQSKPAAATQGFSNGLLFGDKAQGANFDASVRVMGSATVKVKGMVKDDSF